MDDAVVLQALVAHWCRGYACRPNLRGDPNSVAAQDYRCAKAGLSFVREKIASDGSLAEALDDARAAETVIWSAPEGGNERVTEVHGYPATMRAGLLHWGFG